MNKTTIILLTSHTDPFDFAICVFVFNDHPSGLRLARISITYDNSY